MIETALKSEIGNVIDSILRKLNNDNQVMTTRLDLKTRICFMSAIIYGTADPEDIKTVQDAVEAAVKIENLSNARIKKMKRDNPIPRAKHQ